MSKGLAAVTGGTGFVGGHLTRRLLEDGWAVRVLARDRDKARPLTELGAEIFIGDLEKPDGLENFFAGADVAFHCAAAIHAAGRDETEYLRINGEGTRTLAAKAATANLKKFVALSSVAAIGIRPGGLIDETFPCKPDLVYGRSKLQAEEAMLEIHRNTGFPVVILRPPTVYGPGERYNFLSLCKAIKNGPFLVIGNGRNRIDFLSVHHLVESMILAAEKGISGEVYLVADARPRPFIETVNILSKLLKGHPYRSAHLPKLAATMAALPMEVLSRTLDAKVPLNLGRIRTMTSDFCFDLRKIRRDTGYNPPDDTEEMMAETVAWYQDAGLI